MLRKKAFQIVAVIFVISGILYRIMENRAPLLRAAAAAPAAGYDRILIIDAGHGGEDGGAVSISGASESNINLAVAKRMDAILGLYGIRTTLTRDTDRSLHTEGAQTLREKKRSDLQNRVSMIRAREHAVLISIHQNSYPDQRYHGAQVFFAPTKGSDLLAQTMQNALVSALDPENHRQPKQIPDNIYLMNHVSCCAVLVECGFLTNPEEERRLLSSSYQTSLATALAGGYLRFQNGLI